MFNSIFNKKKDSPFNGDFLDSLIKEIKEIGGIDDIVINGNTKFVEIGFDSILYINLLLKLEDLLKMDIELIVSEIDLTAIHTINDLYNTLIKLKSK